ncbi:MAG: HAMP domain-containing protein [Proteobacteria bacterium]|nr:HAMP domain-containing protein [Pseudomonadota bacterium]
MAISSVGEANAEAGSAATDGAAAEPLPRRPRLSLRVRLAILALAAILPSMFALGFVHVSNQRLVAEQAKAEALRLAKLIAAEQDRNIEAAEELLYGLSYVPEIRDGVPGACAKTLALVGSDLAAQSAGRYTAVALLRPDGRIYCASVPIAGDPDRSDRPFFSNAMRNRAFSLGVFRIGGLTPAPVLIAALPILDQQGKVVNIISIGLRVGWLARLLREVPLPEGAAAIILDEEGRVLARHPDNDAWVGRSAAGTPLFELIKANREGTAYVESADGRPRYVGFTAVSDSLPNVYVNVGFDASEVFGSEVANLLRGPGLTAAVGVLTLVLILVLGQRILLRNLDRLIAATRRMAAGDLAVRTGLQGEPGEFGDLGRSFDAMAESLRRRETDLQCRTEELARSNAELEQFAYVASHDLQEPLRAVASYTQLLERRYEGQLDERAQKYLRHAGEGARRMQALIEALLAYSRVTTRGADFQPVDCGEAVEAALRNLEAAIEESGAKVERGPLPTVAGDREQLIRVFQNLIGNAIKFRGERTPEIRVSAERVGDDWRFAVSDNGIGFDPQFADRIFIIFQRLHTREQYPGLGLGLSICKRIVERHGGRLWAQSIPGEGSTFHFTLPVEVSR